MQTPSAFPAIQRSTSNRVTAVFSADDIGCKQMEIDVAQLKAVVNRLLDHVMHDRGVQRVELGSDLYWVIPEEAAYNLADEPEAFDVGRLSDDWEFVSKLLNADEVPVAYQLTEVAPLLKRLGEVLGRDLASKGG